MTLVGGYQSKHFVRLIKKYIEAFVRCNDCRAIKTEITKEDRLTVLKCKMCKASRTVDQIKTRFMATRRGARRKARH
jgi:translation initiation factor 2 beta subunit (eIF-2beta)/eIF-5